MIEQIDHINIVVSDQEQMLHFYEKSLGFKISKRVEIHGNWIEDVVGLKEVKAKVAYLALTAGLRIELIQYLSPVSEKLEGIGIPNTLGIRHIAFWVIGIADWVTKLKAESISFFCNIQQVPGSQVRYADGLRRRLVYFYDPEGSILGFCEYHPQNDEDLSSVESDEC